MSNNTIIINSSNVSNTSTNAQFTYRLIGGNYKIPDGAKMCVSSIQIPYSIFNITQYYNNNIFEFSWTVGPFININEITLPDGFYDITSINLFLELYCINNGYYLIDASGNNVYYFVMAYNVTYYAVQLIFFTVPTSLPVGYSQPANFAGFPTVATTPGFNVQNNNFSQIVGFYPGTYGNQLNNFSLNSAFPPTGSPVNSLILRCNLVDNAISSTSDILDSFTIGQAVFGSNIDYTPSFQKYVKIKPGTYSDIIFNFVDQNLNTVFFKDINVLITILIEFSKS